MDQQVEKKKSGGLAGVIAGDSAICLCGVEEQSLRYRGYAIEDLAEHASFEETAWLLLRGELPTKQELENYRLKLKKLRDIPTLLKEVLEKIPANANAMDVLRTGCSFLGNIEPEIQGGEKFAIADRLLASLGSMLLYWRNFHRGKPLQSFGEENSLAGYLLQLITGKKPSETNRRCLDVSLILYAEHEFNASTFTVRTIASTLSDFYSAICGGIGALRGPLHGGANEAAMQLIEQFHTPAAAEAGVRALLAKKSLIMGFGHRVYTTSDPRSAIIKKWAQKLSHTAPDGYLFPIGEKIEEVMRAEKKLFPNLDFYSALAYHFIGIPTHLFTPLFVLSRISGWSAHLLEQRENNKLIRPLSHYIGPQPQVWNPMEQRVR